MQLVSSVYHNRINAGMRLDADPTREYVNDYITGNSLLGDTSKYAALYNTYKCSIPAGPICNPSKRAIEAAQNPPATIITISFFGNDNQKPLFCNFGGTQSANSAIWGSISITNRRQKTGGKFRLFLSAFPIKPSFLPRLDQKP